jgi:transcriptional regulator with XRE-family HTH domain
MSPTSLQNTRKLVGAQVPQNLLLMKSIGDQVRDFRIAKGWKPAEMAAAVGGRVRRQHIEQLEAAGNRIPKYLGQLALAMDTTADAMLAQAGLVSTAPTPPPPSGRLADRLKAELEEDPYDLIQRGLAALLIVSHAKDEIMQKVKDAAEVAQETQRAWEAQLRQKEKR